MNLTLVKELFAGFLRTRHFGRHFRRLALFESLAGTQVSRGLPPGLAQELIAAATSDADALQARLDSHTDRVLAYFPILAVIVVGYMSLTQLMKGYYTRRFGWQ